MKPNQPHCIWRLWPKCFSSLIDHSIRGLAYFWCIWPFPKSCRREIDWTMLKRTVPCMAEKKYEMKWNWKKKTWTELFYRFQKWINLRFKILDFQVLRFSKLTVVSRGDDAISLTIAIRISSLIFNFFIMVLHLATLLLRSRIGYCHDLARRIRNLKIHSWTSKQIWNETEMEIGWKPRH